MPITETKRTENNFDFLRLLAASLVIFSHSYPLTGHREILQKLTGGQTNFGGTSVDVFFILSGYLIMISMRNSPSLQNFLWKRMLRLFPALLVMLLISLPIIAVVYTGNNLLAEKKFWTYLPRNLSLYMQQNSVPHVFSSNPFPNYINGSLWSLPYEFTLYLMVGALFFVRKSKILLPLLISLFCISFYCVHFREQFLTHIWDKCQLKSEEVYRLAQYFTAGSILSFFNLKILNRPIIKYVLLALLALSFFTFTFQFAAPLLLPLLILLVANSYSPVLNALPARLGDISYGIYIYGFIVQQTFVNYFSLDPTVLTVITLPPVVLLAWLSWQLVEKKCLRFKNFIS